MDSTLIAAGRETILLVLLASTPALGAALAVGLAAGILQAATQVQEATVAVVPRLVAVLVALGLAGPWMGARAVKFALRCLELAARVSL